MGESAEYNMANRIRNDKELRNLGENIGMNNKKENEMVKT